MVLNSNKICILHMVCHVGFRYLGDMSTQQNHTDGDPMNSSVGDTTHFGFQTVDAKDKAGLVREVFDAVADRYDVMNDLMSFGIHRLWKSSMIDVLNPRPGKTYLDVAGGTGDIAFRIHERIQSRAKPTDPPPRIMIADINTEMLRVGRQRAEDRGIADDLEWMALDAQHLPLPDKSVDAYTIAFGLRNVTDISLALKEAHRVLKPGGRFLCLEFSKVVLPVLDKAYDVYSFNVLPFMGKTVAQNPEAYRYLAESIRQFPAQQELCEIMKECGFHNASVRNYSGGIAALHSGWRI